MSDLLYTPNSPQVSSVDDYDAYNRALETIKSDVTVAALHGAWDGTLRGLYTQAIMQMSAELEMQANAGLITWADAAREANRARNEILMATRGRNTPVGRAFSQALKEEGKTLNRMIAEKTIQLKGPGSEFGKLTAAEQELVFAKVVQSAGKSRGSVNRGMLWASRGGKAILILSVAISVYVVLTADDKVAAAKREVAVTGAGIAGGIAAGALAGLMCGPGAPVCVTLGAFAGGTLAAIGVDLVFF
ncbi:hypothetical protein [Sphingomonas bacterium]|uniref:hypothetical protein n=1 Tax=Sphingomonas bacterium TaxID=1895847 RepID=UPI001575613A|nr:hypothetical protein [Sphingomonas bacterium]